MTTPAGAAALVLSHLAAVPAAVFLVRRHAWTTLTVLSVAVIISTTYHMCQVGWMCFGSTPAAFQISDHFTVYFSITWFLLWGSGAPERVVMSATIAITGLALPLIVSDPDNWLSGIIVISAAAFGFLICYSIYTRIRGESTVNWLPLVAALIMIGAGSVFHVMAGDFGEGNTLYPIAHTIWHVFALIALYFAAMVRYWGPSVVHAALPVRKAAVSLARRASKPPREQQLNLSDIRLEAGWRTRLHR